MGQASGEVHPVAHLSAIDGAFSSAARCGPSPTTTAVIRISAGTAAAACRKARSNGSGRLRAARRLTATITTWSGSRLTGLTCHASVSIAFGSTRTGVAGSRRRCRGSAARSLTAVHAMGSWVQCVARSSERNGVRRAVEQRVHGDDGRDAGPARSDSGTERERREETCMAVDLVVPATEHGALDFTRP